MRSNHLVERFLASLVLLTVVCTLPWVRPASADTERRVALVIGNGGYTSVPSLPNPINDAMSVAAVLKRLGFEVTEGYDLATAQMRAKMAEFFSTLPDAKAALIYYAGHGVSVDGENFLIPTDVALKSPADLDLQAINMSMLLKQLKREERVNVIIMDACRDNPFAGDLAHAKTRALVSSRGLSVINNDLAKGTMIAYASDPNSTALDGKPGQGSPFTRALLRHIEEPNISIGTVMDRVRTAVWSETGNRQMPWVNTSLIGEFIINPRAAPAEPVPVVAAAAALGIDRFQLENRLWDSAERGNSQDDYRAYVEAYPNGLYAPMARSRIARLIAAEPKDAARPISVAAGAEVTDAFRQEVGTELSEATLTLDAQKRREVQARLAALQFDVGEINGTIGPKTRNALVGWQKNHGIQPTGWLGPLQYAALQRETDSSYQAFVTAPAVAPRAPGTRTRSISAAPPARRPAPARYVRERRPRTVVVRQQAAGGGGANPAAAFLGGVIGGVFGRFR